MNLNYDEIKDLRKKIKDAVGNSQKCSSITSLLELLDFFITKVKKKYYPKLPCSNSPTYDQDEKEVIIYEREFIFDHLVYYLAEKIIEPWRDGKDLGKINYQYLSEKDFLRIGTTICSVLWHWYGVPSDTQKIFQSDKESQYFNDLLSILDEYGHIVVGIDRKLDFISLYRNFFLVEPVFYFIDRYRDHIYHTIYITILGSILLDMEVPKSKYILIPGSKPLVDLMVENIRKNPSQNSIKKDDIYKAWFLAGLLHDIGYIIKLSKLLKDHLKKTPFSKDVENLISSIEDKVCEKTEYYQKEYPGIKILPKSHGIYSAEFIQKSDNIDMFKDKPYFKMALKAIIQHDNDEIIDFKESPVSFLLLLLDEIQEYERPLIHKERFRTKLYYDIHSEGHKINISENIPSSILMISKLTPINDSTQYIVDKGQPFLTFTVRLGEVDFLSSEFERYLKNNPTFILNNWLGKIKNLKRLKLNDDIIKEIHVIFELPKNIGDKFVAEQITYFKGLGYNELAEFFDDKDYYEYDPRGERGKISSVTIKITDEIKKLPKYYFEDEKLSYLKDEIS